jgi:GTPase
MAENDQEMPGLLLPEELPADHRSGFVVVVGRPNVGKSTLMNAYLGQKLAIVSSKPQTTRNRLLGILTRPDAQVIFVDTPGIHRPFHKLGEHMVETALGALRDADVALFLVDVSMPPDPEDEMVAQAVGRSSAGRKILVMNKADLVSPAEIDKHRQAYLRLAVVDEEIVISATRGNNREELLRRIVETLPFGPRYFPEEQVTDQEERFLASEFIREQVLRRTHQEVPHAVAVVVHEFKERRPDLTYIGATILVERDSQKGILIGESGRMLKLIGSGARAQIEDMVGHKVFLELWVKVRKQWRSDEAELRRLGLVMRGD